MSKEIAQEELQKALVTTFLANLAFLSEYDNNLYHRIDELSRMITEGSYKEKYKLEFIMENGDFDIHDEINNNYLYNRKPKEWNNKIVKDFQLDEKNSILTLEANLYSGEKVLIDNNVKYNLENINEGNSLTINDISEYFDILKNKPNHNKKLKEAKKTIFLGTLLGRHISRIAEKYKSEVYLVSEKNLEIFRLSLFVTDYSILARDKIVIFSIMEDEFTFEKKVMNFLVINKFSNYLIKLCATDINIQEYIDGTLSTILNAKPSSFDYNRILYNFVRNVSLKLNSKYNILLIKDMKNKFKLLNNIPILFIASGPSLDENLTWIIENQNNFYIVSIGSAAKKLLENNIRIDMLFTLDPQYNVLDKRQFPEEVISKLENTIIIASMITDERILTKFKIENVFIYEVFFSFYKENKIFDVSSVGELAVGFLLNMNIEELYLVGLDLALDKNTGKTHSSGTSGIREFKTNNSTRREDNIEIYGLRTRTFQVPGNFEKKVSTTGLFSSSIFHLNKILEEKEEKIKVYNLSSHGAAFINTFPICPNDIIIKDHFHIIDKNEQILKELYLYSSSTLSEESKENIQKEIIYIRKIIDEKLNNIRNNKFDSYDNFYDAILNMLIELTSYSKNLDMFTILIENNTQILFNYFGHCFNDIKIKDENKKVNKVKDIYMRQLEELIENYLKYLDDIVK
jgi:hypothetical protein